MYTIINNIKIDISFDSGITVYVEGPDKEYYIEVSEYRTNENIPKFVEGYSINVIDGLPTKRIFKCPIEFYFDFEITIYKFVDKFGLQKIFSHRYNDFGKLVKFILTPKDYDECVLWYQKIKEYQNIHGCEILLETPFDDINKSVSTYYQTTGISPYKTYNIGRFPKTSYDWKTIEPRKENLIWFGYWKTFWSYQHPRHWKELSSEEIIKDILSL
jgi:hypothetical protein